MRLVAEYVHARYAWDGDRLVRITIAAQLNGCGETQLVVIDMENGGRFRFSFFLLLHANGCGQLEFQACAKPNPRPPSPFFSLFRVLFRSLDQ